MKEMPLTQGRFAIVDDEDFEALNQYRWHYYKCASRNTGYARRNIRLSNGRQVQVLMHRSITKAAEGIEVDHENGDGLDNRKSNLRPATRLQNAKNRTLNRDNTSGYKGVSWKKHNKKWCAQIRISNKPTHVGYFKTAEEAAAAYNEKAVKHYGTFARLNQM